MIFYDKRPYYESWDVPSGKNFFRLFVREVDDPGTVLISKYYSSNAVALGKPATIEDKGRLVKIIFKDKI